MNPTAALLPLDPLGLAARALREAARKAWRELLILVGITTAMVTSFKVQLFTATHDFTNGADVFKMALFKAQAALTGTYGASTANYSDMTGNADEIPNGAGYTTGGVALTNTTPTSSGTTAFTTPSANAVWNTATFTTRGCMMYNSSKTNKCVFVYDFGADEPVVSGTLTLTMPANTNVAALLRVA